MPALAVRRPLSQDERSFLVVALQEAKARGIVLPKEVQEIVKREKVVWPVGGNGYFLRNDGKQYIPSVAQKAFTDSASRLTMYVGSRGSGKTAAGSQKALFKLQQGLSGSVMNPDFENFKYSTWPEFKEWIPWGMVVPSQKHRKSEAWEPHQPFTMVFTNGAKAYCKGLKNPDSARGPNLNWLWYDEGGRDETGLGFKIALASVRVGDHPQAWVTETPKSREHWSYKMFILKDLPQEVLDAFASVSDGDKILIEAFHGTIKDNKDNLDPAFYASILAAYPSGWMRTQEVEGEFADEGGKIGDRAWFEGKILDTPPENLIKRVRFWDLAATEKKQAKDDPDETVGSLMSTFIVEKEKNYVLEDQVAGYWDWDKLLVAIANTARHDGPYIPIYLEEEPGSGGKNQIAAVATYFRTQPDLASHVVKGLRARETGDRVMAANLWFAIAAKGKMWMCRGSWNEKFLSQLDGFTLVIHDDRVTSISGGMRVLSPFKSWAKLAFASL